MSLEVVNKTYEMFSFWGYMKLIKYKYKNYRESSCIGFSKELFTEMKQIGFSNHLIETNVNFDKWNEVPYGNYNLKQIDYGDFTEVSLQQIKGDIDYYLLNEGANETLSIEYRSLLIDTFNRKFYQLIPTASFSVKFKPLLSIVDKKLSWGGQFDHFQSYIFVSINCEEVIYLEFGYD